MIRLLGLDVDGVLTDGKLYYGEQGETLKVFNVKDGQGIVSLQKSGVEVAIITARSSKMVEKRAQELGIKHLYMGQKNKVAAMEKLLGELAFNWEQTAYMGDDLPDIAVLEKVKLSMAPFDAVEKVTNLASWKSSFTGGNGAVRQACDYIIDLNSRD